ncbi:hypothetical protein ACFGVS_04335 [Mucilaginibacter sp. AW1-7]|uniref:hypothetical protein n=1 Tax=Mucilaginibacter sp. AW1-7 TaxID=3349874 RepID=UPI003F737AEB
MKISTLFEELDALSVQDGIDDIFEKSGMSNRYKELNFGFFPLGSGILTKENCTIDKAEVKERRAMILGNDFGTISYVDNLNNKCETNSPTIRNLTNTGLDLENSFFTNFYMGLRDNIRYPKTTMIYRQEAIKKEYKALCSKFFKTQMKLINPSIVICLGQEVKKALIDSELKNSFTGWKPKSGSIAKLYSDNNHSTILKNEELAMDCTFIIIPHPCDIRNFNGKYQNILKEILKNKVES